MSEELKPCPFCGGEAHIIAKPYEPKVCVGCDDDTCLGFSGLGWLYDSEEGAAEAWNRRAERTCKPVVVDIEEPSWGYIVECSECRHTLGGVFTSKEAADRFASALPVYYLQYCAKCGAKVVKP